jgi:hypothetical protein
MIIYPRISYSEVHCSRSEGKTIVETEETDKDE